jgi:protein N-terminal amidase
VFYNRTGAEEEAIYTRTSAIIGIRQDEIFVYGVLGRGVVDLLVVDTDCPPRYKLTDINDIEGSEPSGGALKSNEACQSTLADDKFPPDTTVTDAAVGISSLSDTAGLGCRPSRPKLTIPSSFPRDRSPHPWHFHDAPQPAVLHRGAVITPITPFEEDGWVPTPIGPKPPHWK